MSLSLVRPYFTTIAIDLGYKKHYDGFPTDNIPSSTFDRTFHVESFEFTGQGQNQTALELEAPTVVRLFFKAYQDVDKAIETATVAGELYIEAALDGATRLSGPGVKNVFFDQMSVEAYAATNDNYVVCRLQFRAKLFKGIC